jgi:hypothetical protein
MSLTRLAPPADWLVPDWPAPAGVHALCTTRAGGVSVPPYDSLNLGSHVGDDLAAVQANRNTLQRAVQAQTIGARATFLNQVHGVGVVHLNASTPDGTDADACTTTTPGAVCTIMVADCLPVLLAHRSGAVVGAAHAGWRGLAGAGGWGVLESIFKCFSALALDGKSLTAINTEADSPLSEAASAAEIEKDTLAWLGPCIGPQAFEVGVEVRAAFCDVDPAAQRYFVPREGARGKYLCDLAGLARLRLQALGITHIYGNNSTAPWCTVANASRFFSHRRDSAALGGSGRFAACIWRD